MVSLGEASAKSLRDGLGNIVFLCVFLLVMLGWFIWWLRR
jgi:hypothetical protein